MDPSWEYVGMLDDLESLPWKNGWKSPFPAIHSLVVWSSGVVMLDVSFALQERKFHALEKEMVQADDEWPDRLALT